MRFQKTENDENLLFKLGFVHLLSVLYQIVTWCPALRAGLGWALSTALCRTSIPTWPRDN